MRKANLQPQIKSFDLPPSRATLPQGTAASSKGPGDAFNSVGGDPFKTLVSGEQQRDGAPIQRLLDSMLMGDDLPMASPADFEQFSVPPFAEISRRASGNILSDPAVAKGVLDRYDALAASIESALSTLEERTGASSGYGFRVDELESMGQFREKLTGQLGYCRQQKKIAEIHVAWAKENAEAAKKEAEQQKQWWEEDPPKP